MDFQRGLRDNTEKTGQKRTFPDENPRWVSGFHRQPNATERLGPKTRTSTKQNKRWGGTWKNLPQLYKVRFSGLFWTGLASSSSVLRTNLRTFFGRVQFSIRMNLPPKPLASIRRGTVAFAFPQGVFGRSLTAKIEQNRTISKFVRFRPRNIRHLQRSARSSFDFCFVLS